jgi:hypothetical protein
MAFTQKPGRTPFLKTGNGLPSALRQINGEDKKGNPNGYNPKTSPVPNAENKGAYEKTLDKTKTNIFLRGGDKKIIKSARIGSKDAESIESEYAKVKADTESRRKENSNFLNSRMTTGETADKNLKSPMKQKVSKKTAYDIKEASNQKLKPGARKHYAENAQAAMKNKKK